MNERIIFSGAEGAAQGIREYAQQEKDLSTAKHAADAEARAHDLPEAKPLEPLCHLHDWNPPPPMPGGPRPDRSECPGCLAERLGGNRPVEERRSITTPQVVDPAAAKETALMSERWEAHQQSQVDDLVQIPGSAAQRYDRAARVGNLDIDVRRMTPEMLERAALDEIEVLREEEREREEKRDRRREPAYMSGLYSSGSQEQVAIFRSRPKWTGRARRNHSHDGVIHA